MLQLLFWLQIMLYNLFSGDTSGLDAFSLYHLARSCPAMPYQTTGRPEAPTTRSSRTRATFIIPVYNCEKLLPHCLDSIYGQTIDKNLLEVILVDDHSSDGSYEICKEYEKHCEFDQAGSFPSLFFV